MAHPHSSPSITPFLWFDGNAEEAADFYCGIFPNSRRTGELRNPGAAPGPKGGVLVVNFELNGHPFTALNGGPGYPFTQAISFFVSCKDQAEIDYYWTRLSAGGKEIACGWLTDKFGLPWQVVPENVGELLRHPAAMQAMMGMVKFDIAALQKAAQG